jgi:dipeptidyl-peptidase-3
MAGCSAQKPKPAPVVSRESRLILRQHELAIYQLTCPEFDALSRQDQLYAYHLSRAALAGRDLIYDQTAPRGLEIRSVLDRLTKVESLSPDFKGKLLRYATKFWAYNGNYDAETSRKFIPEFTYEDLLQAVSAARSTTPVLPSDQQLTELRPYIFDRNFLPVLVNKNPITGDQVTSSAVNLYEQGITRADVENAESRYLLNGRFARAGTVLVEEVYRAGAPDVSPGRMAPTLEGVIAELEIALTYARSGSRDALQALIEYFRTGEPEAFDRHCRAWVADKDSPVDYILGFIETYKDPLGQRGAYEGTVFIEDTAETKVMATLAENSPWFEQRMPWDDQLKKRDFTLPSARAFKVLFATGDGGPCCPVGINLPNDQTLRETVGTKNFLLTNVMQSGSEQRWRTLLDEFLSSPEERELALKHYSSRRSVMIGLHEVVGHGSGKATDESGKSHDGELREFGSTLEEARADLVAYWFIGDPHLIELGIIPEGDHRRAAYTGMMASALTELRDVPEGDQFEEDHARAGALIRNYVMEKGGGESFQLDGKRFYRLKDLDRAHQAVGELLAMLQKIKADGDYQAARDLIGKYGIKFEPELRDEVIRRAEKLDLPTKLAYAMPELVLNKNKMGGIKGVEITYPEDFVGQMLRFGAKDVTR